ncbi:hypothetical protein [Actinoplanes sp. NPDC051851]|uniref:hypothetical protein n=1 Tax=Actinoplanes sp. NPDC051851 TaxID=3154753 RepID=UPI00344209A6
MSAVDFVVALRVNRVVGRFGATPVLTAGLAVTLAGMVWLSRAGDDSGYPVAVALPMVLIGVGQGLAFAPLTSAGLAGVAGTDAGAASGLVNTFHQVGSALGLGVLTSVAATSALVDRVGTALTGSAVMLLIALLLVVMLIARGRSRLAPPAEGSTAGTLPGMPSLQR